MKMEAMYIHTCWHHTDEEKSEFNLRNRWIMADGLMIQFHKLVAHMSVCVTDRDAQAFKIALVDMNKLVDSTSMIKLMDEIIKAQEKDLGR